MRSPRRNIKWHPEYIKAEIRMRGTDLSKLALENGLSESAVRVALRRPLLSGELAISRLLCVPLHELFPERWDAQGNRLVSSHARHLNVLRATAKG